MKSKRSFLPLVLFAAAAPWGTARSQCQIAELSASDAAPMDTYGRSVDIDGNTLVVGAQHDDHSGYVDAGSAYVYVWNGASWLEQAKLLPVPGAGTQSNAGDWFGTVVAIDGDTIALAASRDDGVSSNSDCNTGGVSVFVRQGTAWTLQQILHASDQACFTSVGAASFGKDVDVCGDTMVIGASADDTSTHSTCMPLNSGCNSGSAYVFERSGGVWTQVAKLTEVGLTSNDGFGTGVAIDGDVIVVGAPDNEALVTGQQGTVYVFNRPPGGWASTNTASAVLTASDGANRDEFGKSVAIEGTRIVVGAPFHEHNPMNADSGSAYVFEDLGGGWIEVAELRSITPIADAQLGTDVALEGSTVLAGVPLDQPGGGVATGSVHGFAGPFSGLMTQTQVLTRFGATGVETFGTSLARSGNFAVVGATGVGFNPPAPNEGAAYVFDLSIVQGPSLFFSPCGISVSKGGTQEFDLDAGMAQGGRLYLLLGSTSYNPPLTPGIPVDCVTLPLNADGYLTFTLLNANTPPLMNSLSFLSPVGTQSASLVVPPGAVASSFIGTKFHHAYLVFQLQLVPPGGTGKVIFASNAAPLTLIP